MILEWITALLCATSFNHAPPRNYIFFGMDREALPVVLSRSGMAAFEGAQVTYSWRQLEPQKDAYDFSLIREDLALLAKHDRKLWIQIQDVSFSGQYNHVPKYVLPDPAYHGGAARQYNSTSNVAQGWVARRWDP